MDRIHILEGPRSGVVKILSDGGLPVSAMAVPPKQPQIAIRSNCHHLSERRLH